MCLIAWNWQPASATPLLLVANRDEFYARPSQTLQWWEGGHILAGKDQQAGGTWLGLSCTGRLAALTNCRDFSSAANAPRQRADAPSRGGLVTQFLNSDLPALSFLQRLAGDAKNFNAFNLLVFDGIELLGLQSRDAKVVEMQPGMGAVSNADFHSPWPKLTWLRDALESHVGARSSQWSSDQDSCDGAGDDAGESNALDVEALFSILKNDAIAPDDALPQTGLPLARERALSAAFIVSPDYGTRASSVIKIARTQAQFAERTFDAAGLVATQQLAFSLDPPPRLHPTTLSARVGVRP